MLDVILEFALLDVSVNCEVYVRVECGISWVCGLLSVRWEWHL